MRIVCAVASAPYCSSGSWQASKDKQDLGIVNAGRHATKRKHHLWTCVLWTIWSMLLTSVQAQTNPWKTGLIAEIYNNSLINWGQTLIDSFDLLPIREGGLSGESWQSKFLIGGRTWSRTGRA